MFQAKSTSQFVFFSIFHWTLIRGNALSASVDALSRHEQQEEFVQNVRPSFRIGSLSRNHNPKNEQSQQPLDYADDKYDNNPPMTEEHYCISDYATLKSELFNAKDNEQFILCRGKIIIQEEITSEANSIAITCAGFSGECTLEKNDQTGRILHIKGNGLTLTGIDFKKGNSDSDGGAVQVSGSGFSPVEINNCRFIENSSGGSGGGLSVKNHGCIIRIEDTIFQNNKASGNGGGFNLVSGTGHCRILCPYTAAGIEFYNNEANGDGGAGYSDIFPCTRFNEGDGNKAHRECDELGASTFGSTVSCRGLNEGPSSINIVA